MRKLKGVVFGTTNVIFQKGHIDDDIIDKLSKTINRLKENGIFVIFLGNHNYKLTFNDEKITLREYIKNTFGEYEVLIAEEGDVPYKSTKEAMDYILKKHNLTEPNEVIYIGNTEADMKTALHSRVLFLNVTWFKQEVEYGLFFEHPIKLFLFIKLFCLREHLWFFKIETEHTKFYSLGPYIPAERKRSGTPSKDVFVALKLQKRDPSFWAHYLCSSIYFSDIYKKINYMSSYPGYSTSSPSSSLEPQVIAFCKSLNIRYVKNLILRHKTAIKSAFARARGEYIDEFNQLNTIKLNKHPFKNNSEKIYKKNPLKNNKTILIFDDINSNGYSLESGKIYLKQTGVEVILASCMKTIGKTYYSIDSNKNFNPYEEKSLTSNDIIKNNIHNYNDCIFDLESINEMVETLEKYNKYKIYMK